MLGEKMAHIGNGAVFVISGRLHDDSDSAGTVSFVEHFFDVAAFILAGTLTDGSLNPVLGKVDGFCGCDGGTQTGVACRITTALGCNNNFLGCLGENLAAQCILTALAVLNICPFGMT